MLVIYFYFFEEMLVIVFVFPFIFYWKVVFSLVSLQSAHQIIQNLVAL